MAASKSGAGSEPGAWARGGIKLSALAAEHGDRLRVHHLAPRELPGPHRGQQDDGEEVGDGRVDVVVLDDSDADWHPRGSAAAVRCTGQGKGRGWGRWEPGLGTSSWVQDLQVR